MYCFHMTQPNLYCSTSVRAIIRRGDVLLVEWLPSKRIAFLPGGTVENGESLLEALNRELREEIEGADFRIGVYRGHIGHRWYERNKSDSCLNHFYDVELTSPAVAQLVAREPTRQLMWISLSSREADTLQPPSLKELLNGDSDGVWDRVDLPD
jgi:8-oxo-dGTP pyrophosphatase MutT (NUDIX family)